jgi:hypothetical protein
MLEKGSCLLWRLQHMNNSRISQIEVKLREFICFEQLIKIESEMNENKNSIPESSRESINFLSGFVSNKQSISLQMRFIKIHFLINRGGGEESEKEREKLIFYEKTTTT